MKYKLLKLIAPGLLLFLCNTLIAQNHILTGMVTDNAGKPLPGAVAEIPATQKIAVADINGKFLIEVNNASDSLLITNVGYITYRGIAGSVITETFVLVYDDAKAKLDEVVVVGFGRQKKATLTGAVSSVSVSEIEKSSVPSMSNAIGGRIPGILTRQASGQPGYDAATVLIRGMGTWAGSRDPLVFVDGVERPLNNINIMEVESFSVLKDASATAVYGARGANGVILITTKKGKIGRPKITVRSEYARLEALRLPQYINGFEYASLMNEGLKNIGQNPRWTPEELQKFKDGSDPYFYPNVNWTDSIMKKNTWQTINNLNVSGGGEAIKYFANIGYTEQDGLWKSDPNVKYKTNANYRRINFRSNVDINLSKMLVLEIGAAGVIAHGNYPQSNVATLFDGMRRTPPIAFPMRNPDGTPGGVLTFLGSNPWGLATQSGYTRRDWNTINSNFGLNWDLSDLVTKGLTASAKFAYDFNTYTSQVRNKAFEVKQYLGKDPVTGEDRYQVHREAGTLGYIIGSSSDKNAYFESKINYTRTFDRHTVGAMGVYYQLEKIAMTATTPILNIPRRTRAYAGRFNYDFDNRYLLEMNVGYTGSENFPKGKRYGFFPSVSAGWIVSNEKFWGDNNPISLLKLRGSYGLVGNDEIGGARFLYLTYLRTKDAPGYLFGTDMRLANGIDEAQTGNSDITWESSKKTNLGIDMEMFKGKVVLQADVFDEYRTGILMTRLDIPFYTGFEPYVVQNGNLGKVRNRGFDGSLNIRNVTSYGLNYSTWGNFTYAKNTVKDFPQAPQRYAYQSWNGQTIFQPQPLVALGLFKDQADIDNSPRQQFGPVRPGDIKYKDVNGDGVVNDFDRVFTGYIREPQIMYGFGGSVGYKNFDMMVFFQGAAKTSIFLDGMSMYPFNDGFGANNIIRLYYDNRFIPGQDNTNAIYPAVTDGNNANNFRWNTLYMKDASYLRLKNAEIGYTFSDVTLSRAQIAKLRIFMNGLNLYTWDKVKIINPESDSGTGSYPQTRQYNFGIQASF